MDFFGMGFGEVVLILLIALIFLGPNKIVSFAQSLGKLVNNIRKQTSELTAQVNREIQEQERELKEAVGPLVEDLQQQRKSIEELVGQIKRDTTDALKTDTDLVIKELQGQGKPAIESATTRLAATNGLSSVAPTENQAPPVGQQP